ncbi:hypothetical protein C8A03DRAFT_16629 [Achaetomium macrosporum]|uniref:Uncharacterized protein n=1 Tax=Achaetomium macrosporum TaxID=79813 RepID=A0AAN7C7D3_9PEZI|nr:hypothetical protein C8A03DRAFT_16629 [Achaetomium macrosporum]
MNPPPYCSHQIPRVTDQVPGRCYCASEILEITLSCLCSVVTWTYTVQNELPQGQDGLFQQHGAGRHVDTFSFRPSPGLMLFSCLVFGCCVSSFTHRRQSKDPFQFIVYIIFLGVAAVIGCGIRTNVHLILLGYLPWATCAAMVTSISGHSLYRWLRPDVRPSQGDEEKARLLG